MISLTSQLSALRQLAAADADRALLSRRITSGLSVADAADTTNTLARSRAITRTTTQLSFVQTSLETGIATVAAASNAVAAASGTLAGMRSVLAAARDPAADLRQLQSQFTALGNTLRTGVAGAAFGGVNLLANSSTTLFDAAPTDERGQTYAIGVDLSRTRLLDTMGTSGILQRPFDLSGVALGGGTGAAPSTLGLSGTATQTDGVAGSAAPGTGGLSGTASSTSGQAANASAPAATGLSGAASTVEGTGGATPSASGLSGTAAAVAGATSRSATTATINLGTRNNAAYGKGDTENLSVTFNGTTRTVKVYQNAVSSRSTLQTELQRAVDAEFGSNTLVAAVDGNGVMSLAAVAAGPNTLSLDSETVTDGDNILTSTLGIQTQTSFSSTTTTVGTDTRAYDDIGTPNATGIDTTDRLQFTVAGKLSGGGTGYVTVSVKVSDILDGSSPTAAKLASALNAALEADSVGRNYFGATVVDGKAAVYHRQAGAQIMLYAVTAQSGNSDTSSSLGFTPASGSGAAARDAVAASATTGSDFSSVTLSNGAALKFDLKVNSAAAKTVTINEATVKAALGNASGGTVGNIGQLVTVATRALSDAGVTGITVSADGNRLRFTKSGTIADGDSVTLSNVQAVPASATQATLTTGSDFAGPRTIAANAKLDFTLTVDNVAKTVSVTQADVQAALSGRNTIANASEFASVVQTAMTRQNLSSVTVAADGAKLKFTKTAAGTGTLSLSAVQGSSTATNAVATSGSDFAGAIALGEGAAITFDVALDGGAATTIRLDKATAESVLSGRSTINTVGELASVAQRALANASLTGITVGTSGSRLTFTRDTAGVGSVTLGTAAATGASATQASLRTGSDFTGPVTVETGASIGFDLRLDGGSAQRVTINRSTVEAALAGRNTINTATEFAQVVTRALNEASVTGVAVSVAGNGIELRKTASGTGSLALGNVASVAGSAGAGTTPGTTTLDGINLAGTPVQSLSASDRAALIDGYIRNLDAISASVGAAGSHLAMVARQLDIQSGHTTRLQTIETGRLNSQVRTDMDRDTARKTALEARLALARQSLGIISEARKNVLALLSPSG